MESKNPPGSEQPQAMLRLSLLESRELGSPWSGRGPLDFARGRLFDSAVDSRCDATAALRMTGSLMSNQNVGFAGGRAAQPGGTPGLQFLISEALLHSFRQPARNSRNHLPRRDANGFCDQPVSESRNHQRLAFEQTAVAGASHGLRVHGA